MQICFDWKLLQAQSHRLFAAAVLMVVNLPCCLAQPASLLESLKKESPAQLAVDARERGDAVRGAILFTSQELSCTKCHVANGSPPIGPDLKKLGRDTSDMHLVESLLDPPKTIREGYESVVILTEDDQVLSGRIAEEGPKSVTIQLSSGEFEKITLASSSIRQIRPNAESAMPADLVNQLQDRKQFLDLLRYLMQLADNSVPHASSPVAAARKELSPELSGIVLLQDYRCSACHVDDVTQTQVRAKSAPSLQGIADRVQPEYLQEFLADPHRVKPGTSMPDLLGQLALKERQEVALALTHFLVSLGKQEFVFQPVETEGVNRGQELFHSIGCVACHSPRDALGNETLAENSIPLKDTMGAYSLQGLVEFLKDPLATRPSGRMPNMTLNHWEATDIASYLISTQRHQATKSSFKVQSDWVEQGKQHFENLGCAQCHSLAGELLPARSVSLSVAQVDQGCLSGKPGRWPEFSLSESQTHAIRQTLRNVPKLSDEDQIALTLSAFRCVNCHERNELGGISAERNPHFQTTNPNLGPQGRLPPSLTLVGAKLNRPWIRQVLVSARSIRPYMQTRMPQYGADNVGHIIDLFQNSDELEPWEFPSFDDAKEMRKQGEHLVGSDGLNCIACHTFQLKEASNMQAVDLTEMAERLQKNWFYGFMHEPQRFSANTIMPSFWPGGLSMRKDILNGQSSLQIEAIWQYLLEGRQARQPKGLVQEPMELLASAAEAVMLRRSYPGIGKRGIGVGYPLQVNLAFDAEQMRLATIWKGKFADPGGVWRSQGHGRVRPLGHSRIEFATGPDLDSSQDPWIVDEGRPPEHQFKGYSLDERMRPLFRYTFGEVQVTDYFQDQRDSAENAAYLLRVLSLHSERSRDQLRFRAATGEVIQQTGDRTFLVDSDLEIRIAEPHVGQVTTQEGVQELFIPLELRPGATKLKVEYRW